MAKNRAKRPRTATSLSCASAILIAALASVARAQDAPEVAQPAAAYPPPPRLSEVAQPEPAYPPPPPVYDPQVVQPLPSTEKPRLPRPPGPSGFERRHHVGLQVGGTGILQAVYRLRAAGPIHLEAGLLGADHGGNFSVGVLVGSPIANRWFPYVGFGGGLMVGGMPPPKTGCDPTMTTCPEKTGDDLVFLHARVGIGVAFGATRRNMVSLDVGAWYGRHGQDWNDTANKETHTQKTIAMPMAGLSYFFAIH